MKKKNVLIIVGVIFGFVLLVSLLRAIIYPDLNKGNTDTSGKANKEQVEDVGDWYVVETEDEYGDKSGENIVCLDTRKCEYSYNGSDYRNIDLSIVIKGQECFLVYPDLCLVVPGSQCRIKVKEQNGSEHEFSGVVVHEKRSVYIHESRDFMKLLSKEGLIKCNVYGEQGAGVGYVWAKFTFIFSVDTKGYNAVLKQAGIN